MKKLIMVGVLALGSLVSFAGNGQKEISLQKFNDVKVENALTSESQEFFNHTANYHIVARIFVCGPGNIGTDWFETATGPNGTGCVDATQLASIITLYENLYGITHADACNVMIFAEKIDDCIH